MDEVRVPYERESRYAIERRETMMSEANQRAEITHCTYLARTHNELPRAVQGPPASTYLRYLPRYLEQGKVWIPTCLPPCLLRYLQVGTSGRASTSGASSPVLLLESTYRPTVSAQIAATSLSKSVPARVQLRSRVDWVICSNNSARHSSPVARRRSAELLQTKTS